MIDPMVKADYFSDVLCVWAYVNELRVNEVREQFGKDVAIHFSFMPNFSATESKIEKAWQQKGGFDGYAAHVREVAEGFDIKLHDSVWASVRPATSMMAHSMIKAVSMVCNEQEEANFISEVRKAFFQQGQDIAQLEVLKTILAEQNLPVNAVMDIWESGQALARLHEDFQLALQYQITISPAWVFNEGRQRLIGNVGYRVIEGNLKELMNSKPLPQAWC